MGVPIPDNEQGRLEALQRYEILDTPPEQEFDDLVQLAGLICDAPIALVTLIDAERQWIKARVGLAVSETTRDTAFCAYTILDREPMIVPDALEDARFAQNPYVTGDPNVRFYAGVPLVTFDGYALGSLCVLDRKPRELTADQRAALGALARQVVGQLELRRDVARRLALAQVDTVTMLAAAAEAHDETTGRHLQRVRAIAEALACELGHSEAQAKDIGLAAVLHDIGKVHVPDAVLTSPHRLNEDEWQQMRQHTIWGAEFLASTPGFELAAVVARSHHEHWDGTGYPDGLRGEKIPEAAAITAVADAFDAITHDRPYRAGRSPRVAVREVTSCSGTQFSPRIVAALVRLFGRDALPMVDADDLPDEGAA